MSERGGAGGIGGGDHVDMGVVGLSYLAAVRQLLENSQAAVVVGIADRLARPIHHRDEISLGVVSVALDCAVRVNSRSRISAGVVGRCGGAAEGIVGLGYF